MRFDTKTLKPGDTAYIGVSGSWDVNYSTAEVLKVTPSGQVVVKGHSGERRFSNRGEEIGCASKWRVPFLVTKERYDAGIEAQRERRALAKLQQDLRSVHDLWGKKDELIAELKRLTMEVERLK